MVSYLFHRFPLQNEELTKRWVDSVKRYKWFPKGHSFLCSAHFEDKFMYKVNDRRRLLANAVPTLFDFPAYLINKTKLRPPPKESSFQETFTDVAQESNDSESCYSGKLQFDDLPLYCRLCATKCDDMVPIFDTDEADVYSTIIRCLPAIITQNDDFPKQVCRLCLSKLYTTAEMMETFLKADRQFRELHEEVENRRGSSSNNWIESGEEETEIDARGMEITSNPTCNVCGKSFESIFLRNEHEMKCSNPIQWFDCVKCKLNFKYKSDLNDHMKNSHTKHYECSECEKMFNTKFALERHRLTEMCQKNESIKNTIDNKSNLDRCEVDVQVNADKKCFNCDVCGKSFLTISHLREHTSTHSNIKSYACEECDKTFTLKATLNRHRKIHLSRNVCDGCNTVFKTSSALNVHKKNNVREKSFKCKCCSQDFVCRLSFKKHICGKVRKKSLTATGKIKPLKCEKCCKYFYTLSSLSAHLDVCSGEKPYKCDHCERRFNYPCTLREHERIHTGERPYHCSVCDKFYRTSADFYQHKKIHSNVKKFACDFCSKTFLRKTELVSHHQTHAGEKQYECNLCCKRFSQKGYLIKHKCKLTGE